MEPVGGCLGEIFTVPETMGFLPRFYHEDHENSCIFFLNVPEKKKNTPKDGIIGTPMNYPETFECRWWI